MAELSDSIQKHGANKPAISLGEFSSQMIRDLFEVSGVPIIGTDALHQCDVWSSSDEDGVAFEKLKFLNGLASVVAKFDGQTA